MADLNLVQSLDQALALVRARRSGQAPAAGHRLTAGDHGEATAADPDAVAEAEDVPDPRPSVRPGELTGADRHHDEAPDDDWERLEQALDGALHAATTPQPGPSYDTPRGGDRMAISIEDDALADRVRAALMALRDRPDAATVAHALEALSDLERARSG